MSTRIIETISDDITIISILGSLTSIQGVPALRSRIDDLLSQGRNKIVLVMFGTTHIDSSGVGEITSALARTQEKGGILVLSNLSNAVLHQLWKTKLLSAHTVYSTLAEAKKSFQS